MEVYISKYISIYVLKFSTLRSKEYAFKMMIKRQYEYEFLMVT